MRRFFNFLIFIFIAALFIQVRADQNNGMQYQVKKYFFEQGVQLAFITITNNSSKPISLFNQFSVHGNIIDKEFIEKSNHWVLSKQITEKNYLQTLNLYKPMELIACSSIISITFFGFIATVMQDTTFRDKIYSFSGPCILTTTCMAALYIAFCTQLDMKRIQKNNQKTHQLFNLCEFWLEAPKRVIEPNKSITFSLLIRGKYEIIAFDNNFDKPVYSFVDELA